jgi:hypothetical protein
MLKKSPFSPAQPLRAETRFFQVGVLASLRGSTYPMRFSEVGISRGAFPFGKIHLQERTAHTKCGLYLLASSLTAALLNSIFEHPAWPYAAVSDMQTIGFLGRQHRYAAAC